MKARSAERLVASSQRPRSMLRRMDPSLVYYVVVGGVATVVGIVADVVVGFRWWVFTVLGLVGALGFTWLTALEDLRHPWRSLRILVAEARDPLAAVRVRAVVHGMPLYAPPSEVAGDRWLAGGGRQRGSRLLSPVLPTATVSWSSGGADLQVTTVMAPADRETPGRRFPAGITNQLLQVEDEPALEGVTTDELASQLAPVTIDVDGRPLAGQLLDLRAWGLGWLATLRLDDHFRLDMAGTGFGPEAATLVQHAPDGLVASG